MASESTYLKLKAFVDMVKADPDLQEIFKAPAWDPKYDALVDPQVGNFTEEEIKELAADGRVLTPAGEKVSGIGYWLW